MPFRSHNHAAAQSRPLVLPVIARKPALHRHRLAGVNRNHRRHHRRRQFGIFGIQPLQQRHVLRLQRRLRRQGVMLRGKNRRRVPAQKIPQPDTRPARRPNAPTTPPSPVARITMSTIKRRGNSCIGINCPNLRPIVKSLCAIPDCGSRAMGHGIPLSEVQAPAISISIPQARPASPGCRHWLPSCHAWLTSCQTTPSRMAGALARQGRSPPCWATACSSSSCLTTGRPACPRMNRKTMAIGPASSKPSSREMPSLREVRKVDFRRADEVFYGQGLPVNEYSLLFVRGDGMALLRQPADFRWRCL